MENIAEGTMNTLEALKIKLREHFDGRIVRKDLTKKIKEGANVPVYVLEFLLGRYCSSDDDEIIETGIQQVKRILADNFVRPDESQKILSQLRKSGSHTVIDMITVQLDIQKNRYFAQFSNLGLQKVPIEDEYPEKYDRLLCGGIWCMVQLNYEYVEEDKKNGYPIQIRNLQPIQMPHIDINDLKTGRKAFSKEEWMDVLLRSIGMEPDALTPREKWLLILRMVPLVENNYNLCELVARVPLARAICTRKSRRIPSWFPVGRPPWPTFSITWAGKPSAWLACGTVSRLTRLPGFASKTKMAYRS